MPDNDPPPPPQQMSQQDEAMAELGLSPREIVNSEGETIIVFVKLQTNEIAANEV